MSTLAAPTVHTRRDLAALAAAALLVNALAAAFITHPGYVDAYYYFGGAVQLARGLGFTEPYQWNYLAAELPGVGTQPPWPSHLYWMPLASILAAPFMGAAESLAGVALSNAALFRAAQAPSVLMASALPLLSYTIAWRLSGRRRHALAAALLTLFSPFYFIYWSNTDAFALHGLAAAGALLAAANAAETSERAHWWALSAGAGAGLAHLARADGVLVLLAAGAWLVIARRGQGLRLAGLAVAGYGLVMAPWLARNLLVVGLPLPAGTQGLWLREYNDLFNYPSSTLTPARYFALGWAAIVRDKWAALRDNLVSLAVVMGGVAAFPFALAGLWRCRCQGLVRLGALYGAALLALMSLAFSFSGARGGFFHSGAALLPWLTAAAPLGLDALVEAAARRLPHWQPEKSKPVFTALLVAGTVVLAATLFIGRVVGTAPPPTAWDRLDANYQEAAAWLEGEAAPTSTVVVNNPPGWYYWSGRPGVALPNGDVGTLLRVMAHYDARWVLLDHNVPAGLAPLFAEPAGDPRLALRASFGGDAGAELLLLERVAAP